MSFSNDNVKMLPFGTQFQEVSNYPPAGYFTLDVIPESVNAGLFHFSVDCEFNGLTAVYPDLTTFVLNVSLVDKATQITQNGTTVYCTSQQPPSDTQTATALFAGSIIIPKAGCEVVYGLDSQPVGVGSRVNAVWEYKIAKFY